MRAMVLRAYGPAENLTLEDVPRPSPGKGELLIEVHASSINPIDWKIRAGIAVVKPRLPLIGGMDVSGVVVETGPGCTRFSVGDEVYASPDHVRQGGFAEYCALPESQCARKPANLSHPEAASLPLVGLTAWACIADGAKLKQGEKILIQAGSGGVGSFAIQLARHLGAEVATTCSQRNHQLVRDLGAQHLIDYRSQRFEEVLPAQDVVLEAMGGDIQERSLLTLRRGGRLASINPGMGARIKAHGRPLGMLLGGLSYAGFVLRGLLLRGVWTHTVIRPPDGDRLQQITELVEAGTIRPVIDRIMPLEELAEAQKYGETGRIRGKVAISVRAD